MRAPTAHDYMSWVLFFCVYGQVFVVYMSSFHVTHLSHGYDMSATYCCHRLRYAFDMPVTYSCHGLRQ